MPIDFSFLEGAAPQKEEAAIKSATANVTIRVDADSLLLCDGDYIDQPFKAGTLTKIQLPIGQHLLEFLYTEDPDIKVEKEVDFPEAGKSYLVIIKVLKDLVDAAAEEVKRKAEEEANLTPEALMEAKLLKEKSGTINGYDYVDLGLPSGLKWATCNVGARSPERYGDYYAWGDQKTMKYYDHDYDWYELWDDISDDPAYDVARAKWGSGWRMPTKSEFQELLDKCKWERIILVGKNGYMVTGPNGNSIFLPSAGCLNDSEDNCRGKDGYYWSSTPDDDESSYSFIACDRCYIQGSLREYGLSVRPVSKLLKSNDDAYIMEELKGLTPEQLKALIAMVKKS